MEQRLGHDFSMVRVHTDATAARSAAQQGTRAYTLGHDVTLGASDVSNEESLAHELVHVAQQSRGLRGGRLASRVEAEAEAVRLARMPGNRADSGAVVRSAQWLGVQHLGDPLDKPLRHGTEKPVHGEESGKQRRYSVEQFIAMWEKEQGHHLSHSERTTLARGCIGITALNLTGGGNPPLDLAYGTFAQALATRDAMNAFLDGATGTKLPAGVPTPPSGTRAVLFAQLFWSNQDPDAFARAAPDPTAFRPDPKTGHVDMTGYAYRAQPGFINFDYGFWDDASQSFWHANHSQPGMKVYQSTRKKFEAGYKDFDRIIYGVAIARNYDPRKAALARVPAAAGPARSARATPPPVPRTAP